MSASSKQRVCLGAFAGAHGVKGETKIKTFTEAPENIVAYGPVETEDGKRCFSLTFIRPLKPGFSLAHAPEILNREDAEGLKGTRLYVDRDRLPAPDEDEFYLNDLVGLKVIDESGAPMGVVNAIYNFGAGDLIELKDIPDVKGLRLVAFTQENVPLVDIGNQVITIQHEAVHAGADTIIPSTDDHNA